MATKTNYQSVVDTLKDRLLTELRDRIHSIVLFGSVARGEATGDSDIDVLVITDGRSATEDRIQHVPTTSVWRTRCLRK
jgi:predicted nucleotidyltransferase